MWVVPKHLSSKSFIESKILKKKNFFFFACRFISSFGITLFLHQEESRFPSTGMHIGNEVCVMLWKLLSHYLFLAYCHMSVGRCSKVLWEMWVQLSVSSMKPSIMFLTKDMLTHSNQLKPNCQTRPSASYFIFHRKIALQPISYMAKMFVAKMSTAKSLTAKIPRIMRESFWLIVWKKFHSDPCPSSLKNINSH